MKKIQFTLFNRLFSFDWFYLALYAGLFAVLINLGFWQLGRSEEKRLLLKKEVAQQNITFKLSSHTVDNAQQLRYQHVNATGHYDNDKQFLLDNQIVKVKAGYFVLTPFILENSQKAILVNRGWLPANLDRSKLPKIDLQATETITITGRVNTFPSIGIKLEGAEIPTETFPSVVQVVDSQILANKLGYPLFSFQLELSEDNPNGYYRQWSKNTLISPEKHIAYAVQWFGLALTLTILFFWHSCKRHHD